MKLKLYERIISARRAAGYEPPNISCVEVRSMASIIQQVGTSLQLVALFLLLIAGIARLLVRSGAWKASRATTRLIINRIFEAALAALIIGVVSPALAPTLDRWLNSDEVFHGAVLSASGEAISDATVNLIAIATVRTNPLGQFDITVPRNRALKEYKLQVKAPGFETLPVLTKNASEMKNVEIRLTPAPPELVKALEPELVVGQYYGVPFILVTMRVENVGTGMAWISEIRGNLSGKDISLVLSPAYWTILNPFGPFAPVTGAFPIPAGVNLNLRVVMTTSANFANLFSQVAALPEYSSQAPCVQKYNGSIDPMTNNAFQIVKAFAEEHFVWHDGDWHLKIDVLAENQAKTFKRDFVLSDGDIGRLRASISLLRYCLAVNMTTPLAQEGSLANFVSK
jgi:hypothetical protein